MQVSGFGIIPFYIGDLSIILYPFFFPIYNRKIYVVYNFDPSIIKKVLYV